MDMSEWILECMGVYNQNGYLDSIVEAFGVDIDTEEEMVELIQINAENGYGQGHHGILGNLVARSLYDKAINRAVEELGLDENKFDYYCNGSQDTDLMYDGEYVTSWEDLETIAGKSDNI